MSSEPTGAEGAEGETAADAAAGADGDAEGATAADAAAGADGLRGLPRSLTVADPAEMHALGLRVAAVLGAGDVVVLTGDLGAGKTTFTRGLGEGLGVRGPVTSPTFVLARTHPSLGGGPALVHVDAYRLANALELDDLDIDFARSVVVVEWGRGLVEALPDSALSIEIDRPHGGGTNAVGTGDADDAPVEPRQVRLEGTGPRWT